MIKYQLICEMTHEFEGWFQTSTAFDEQNNAGFVTCPVCDSAKIRRALMTPNIASPKRRRDPVTIEAPPQISAAPSTAHGAAPIAATSSPQKPVPTSPPKAAMTAAAFGEAMAQLRQLQRKIKAECRDVGTDFAAEARKIHYGDSPAENIYGQSTAEEREQLADEGIDVVAMPWLPPEH